MTTISLMDRRSHVFRRLRQLLVPAGTQRHRVLYAVRRWWKSGAAYDAQELLESIRFRVRVRTFQAVINPRDAKKILPIIKEEGLCALLRRAYSRVARVWRPHRRKHRPVYTIARAWGPLVFPKITAPVVSIVIPVHNNHLYTYTCLQSILQSQPKQSYEVIVVDDCSNDATQPMLQVIQGIRIVRNDKNQGFIRSCNAGAGVALGQYVLFLNNDTIVQRNWLDALTSTFDMVPNVGLVGAKLIYPNGKLQEAGGIIWNDGSGWNYGRYDDPDKPEYSYLREVDYCSGACIMLPRELFGEVGGFDELFAPAYGEDSDLAFKIRQARKKVVYQPESEVIHCEGVSSGTDTSSGAKRYQLVNREKLFQKWAHVLVRHAAPGEHLHMERERNIAKRVLIVDACTPMPDQDAGSLKIYNFIKVFQSLSYHVTLAPDNLTFVELYSNDLQQRGVQCLCWPYVSSLDDHLRQYGMFYDLILSCRPDVTEKYLDSYRKWCPSAKIFYDTADLHYLRERRQAEIEGNALLRDRADRRKAQELRLVTKTDCTIVVSELERSILQAEVPKAHVVVVSAIHETYSRINGFAETQDLFFLGGYQHVPNVDAVQYFVKDVFPLLRKCLPGVRFFIVGSRPPQSVTDLACDDVIVTGHVPDLSPYVSNCRLSVNPLRYGAGIKGKIVSCMAYGIPCVGTTIAFEGMGLENGRDVLIGDTPEELAAAIVRLYWDEPLWTKFSKNGYSAVRSRYSFEAARTQFDRMCNDSDRSARVPQIPSTYYGTCNICGQRAQFKTFGSDNLRESLLCEVCGASCRNRSLAWGLLNLVGNGTVRSISDLALMKSGPRIFDTDCFSPVFTFLSKADFYMSSMYVPDRPFGELIKPKILNVDLQSMTFSNASYDVIITSDVMEHVRRDEAAHREIYRCLRTGGYYIFTVPYVPAWQSNQVRVDSSGAEDVYVMEKQYHGDPMNSNGVLVYRIYGQELIAQLKCIGFDVTFLDSPEPRIGVLTKDVFVCKKL